MSQSIEVDFAALEREAERYGTAAAELEAHRDYARRQREQVKETMCRWHYEAAGAAMERGWEESANRHDTLVNARRGMQEDTHAANLAYQRTEDGNATSLHWQGGDAGGSTSATSSGSGQEGTQPLPGHSDSTTTTTLQHGGTEALPQRDAQGHRVLTEPGASSYSSGEPYTPKTH